MAEVDTGGGKKKASTKVDMTPMVDLAFLLITFFMLTTTFNKPKTMEVNMPDKNQKDDKQKTKESLTTTLVLAENNRLFTVNGVDNPVIQETSYSPEGGLRAFLLKNNREKMAQYGKDAVYIIKAMNTSKYKNMVDVLDEMSITKTAIYAIVDISPADEELVKKYIASGTGNAPAAN